MEAVLKSQMTQAHWNAVGTVVHLTDVSHTMMLDGFDSQQLDMKSLSMFPSELDYDEVLREGGVLIYWLLSNTVYTGCHTAHISINVMINTSLPSLSPFTCVPADSLTAAGWLLSSSSTRLSSLTRAIPSLTLSCCFSCQSSAGGSQKIFEAK